MSGHSKWATTKHKKAAIDAKRSALFSKLSRNITVAAKLGGDPNPDNNASLAAAVARARMVSMPNAKIKAAIDKAFGAGADAAVYTEITYEGYGPAGVAVYVDCLTDNKNRTAADVRSAFTHAGGSLGTAGSVAFQFERKGSIAVDKIIRSDEKKVADRENAVDEDEFMMAVAEAGGEDYEDAGEQWIVWTRCRTSRRAWRPRASRSRAPSSPWSPPPRPTSPSWTPRRSSASSTVLTSWRTSRTSTTP